MAGHANSGGCSISKGGEAAPNTNDDPRYKSGKGCSSNDNNNKKKQGG